ncbi:hypothetical protein [Pacificispira sp.]|uniref:hypothetical protein n=1 Tax=Pacificispira sp. TaxID=2888761 RepID=UPI003BAAE845
MAKQASILAGLTATDVTKPKSTKTSSIADAREVFVKAAKTQIETIDKEIADPEATQGMRRWYFEKGGAYFVAPYYGNRQMPVNGSPSFQAGDSLAACKTVLETLIKAAEAGELDKAILDAKAKGTPKAK